MNGLDLLAIDVTFVTGALVFWFGAGVGQRMTRIGLKVGKEELDNAEAVARRVRGQQKAHGPVASLNELNGPPSTGRG